MAPPATSTRSPPPGTSSPADAFWSASIDALFARLGSSPRGLTGEESARRLRELGLATTHRDTSTSSVRVFARQFGNPLVLLLTAAAILSIALGEHMDSAIILDALRLRVREVEVFAEVEPSQKDRIIRSLRSAGDVVGFLGDGIDDATALHTADVGISVDSAVDVTKDAADIVLLEKNLSVLVAGIRHGRRAFANTLKYILITTSANFGNMVSMAVASLFTGFLPMLPKQICWSTFSRISRPSRWRRIVWTRSSCCGRAVGQSAHPQLHDRVRSRELRVRPAHVRRVDAACGQRCRAVPHRLVPESVLSEIRCSW